MKVRLSCVLVGMALVLAAIPAFAHHPFDSEFDWKKGTTLTGTVTDVTWTAPHAMVTMDVRGAKGTVTKWTVELGSPKVLEKYYRWNQTAVKTGNKVTVEGWLARDGRKLVSARSVKLTDGQELFGASSFFDLPGRSTKSVDLPGKCVSDEVCVGEPVD